jgi:hypothetical protein
VTPSGGRRRVAVAGAAVVVVVLAVFGVAAATREPSDPFAQARDLLESGSGFETALEAGETLARVAQHLEQSVEECRAEARGTSCQAIAAALGYTQVLATWVLDCTDPGRYEARTRMAAYLDEVAAVRSDDATTPSPPELPACQEQDAHSKSTSSGSGSQPSADS